MEEKKKPSRLKGKLPIAVLILLVLIALLLLGLNLQLGFGKGWGWGGGEGKGSGNSNSQVKKEGEGKGTHQDDLNSQAEPKFPSNVCQFILTKEDSLYVIYVREKPNNPDDFKNFKKEAIKIEPSQVDKYLERAKENKLWIEIALYATSCDIEDLFKAKSTEGNAFTWRPIHEPLK